MVVCELSRKAAVFGLTCAALAVGPFGFAGTGRADELPVFELTIKDHGFQPAELEVPARAKIKLMVTNADATPEEFESYELNREKVVAGGGQITVFVGPLDPGTYPFFGDFNQATAQGRLIAK